MTRVVVDSSALIALAACEGLSVLDRLYDEIQVPQAVYDEVVLPGKPMAEILAAFLLGRVASVDMTRWVLAAGDLGRGELEAMALYKQISADVLVIDDRRARLIAEQNQISCKGTLGVLLQARRIGAIERILPFVERLRQSPVYFSEGLLSRVLELAGE